MRTKNRKRAVGMFEYLAACAYDIGAATNGLAMRETVRRHVRETVVSSMEALAQDVCEGPFDHARFRELAVEGGVRLPDAARARPRAPVSAAELPPAVTATVTRRPNRPA